MNKIAALLAVVAAILFSGIAHADQQFVVYTLTGTSTEINSGVTVEVEQPMRVSQIAINFGSAATGNISLKLDSAQGAAYDTIVDTTTVNGQYYYFNEGDSNPHLYKKISAGVTTWDKLIIDGTNITNAFSATIYMEPQ